MKAQQNTKRNKTDRRQRRQRIVMAVLAAVLAVLMLLPTISMIVTYAGAVTQSEIDSLKKDKTALAQEKKELQNQLKSIQNDKSKAMDQKLLLEQEIGVIQSEINNIAAQIALYTQQISEKEVELAQAQEEEAAQYELFCERVRYMEEDGNVSYWSILFNAADFSDLLDRYTMVSEIMDYDNAVMNRLIAIREQIARDKEELEEAKAGQEAAKAEQETAKAELKSQEAEVDKLVKEISAKEDDVEGAIDDLESEAAAMDKEIAALEKKLQEQLAASGGSITSEKGYLWPLSGYKNLSSLYAGRIDPFTGRPATHTGIDIPAPKGTAIKAAKSGIVITSAYNRGGYGQYVVISHGNGNTTLYAHMVPGSQKVKVGDVVKQGQVIGQVGTSGRSTGYHLHFEVRVNNVRVDPASLFSGLTYKGKPLT